MLIVDVMSCGSFLGGTDQRFKWRLTSPETVQLFKNHQFQFERLE